MTVGAPSLAAEHRRVCEAVYMSRPDWVAGTISLDDARYLFGRVLAAGADPVVEVGTASGVSTAIVATALDLAAARTAGAPPPRLFTYDISPYFYADPSHATGDAAREMVPDELTGTIIFRQASAAGLRTEHGADAIAFLFLDANHKHPMPAIDLLAALDALAPGAEVAMHDINLPRLRAEFADWGAKHVFDGLDLEKYVDPDVELPNIGSVIVPQDKAEMRDQLLELLYAHPWETEVAPDYLARMLASPTPDDEEGDR